MNASATKTGIENLTQEQIDASNAAFWDELCGSQFARHLNLKDHSPESLGIFDEHFFDFYPYLFAHLPFSEMKGKRVLEVGMGYGSVTQKIINSGARFNGLDIAEGPVAMALHRSRLSETTDAEARQGNILNPPFDPDSFDWVVAIGCLHHTGNLPLAIDSVYSLLKTGGEACIMVYNAASYRQFLRKPVGTSIRKLSGPFVSYERRTADESERAKYDTDSAGAAAPQTELVTESELRKLCAKFSSVRIRSENIGAEGILQRFPRNQLCRWLGPVVGLDLYCRMVK